MGMREYNADNKTTRLVGKWETRKGGYSNDADLEKSSARQLPLWANVQRKLACRRLVQISVI